MRVQKLWDHPMRCGKDPSTTEHERPYDTCITHLLQTQNVSKTSRCELCHEPGTSSCTELNCTEGTLCFPHGAILKPKLRQGCCVETSRLLIGSRKRLSLGRSSDGSEVRTHFMFTSIFPCNILRRLMVIIVKVPNVNVQNVACLCPKMS